MCSLNKKELAMILKAFTTLVYVQFESDAS
jgi:hypothetical protein